jgi:hypothetical protein
VFDATQEAFDCIDEVVKERDMSRVLVDSRGFEADDEEGDEEQAVALSSG